MEWVVMCDQQPLSKLDYKLTRKLSKCGPVSSKSMRKYILSVTESVEKCTVAEIPKKFAVLFDGWTLGTTQCVAVYASYMKNDAHKCC
jgi:hypothetical protein